MPTANFTGRARNANGPAHELVEVTPSDVEDLPSAEVLALYAGGAGDLRVVTVGGAVVTLVSAASQYHPVRVRRVMATGTTATKIVALY